MHTTTTPAGSPALPAAWPEVSFPVLTETQTALVARLNSPEPGEDAEDFRHVQLTASMGGWAWNTWLAPAAARRLGESLTWCAAVLDGQVPAAPAGSLSLLLQPPEGATEAEFHEGHGFRSITVWRNGARVVDVQIESCIEQGPIRLRGLRWYGTETHVDQYGREWKRSLGDMVIDDFGNLVEVDL